MSDAVHKHKHKLFYLQRENSTNQTQKMVFNYSHGNLCCYLKQFCSSSVTHEQFCDDIY